MADIKEKFRTETRKKRGLKAKLSVYPSAKDSDHSGGNLDARPEGFHRRF
jgi:hypothetical protein